MAKLPYKNIYVENRICNLESVCWGPVNLSCRVVLDLRSTAYLLNIKPKCEFKFRFQSKPGIWVSSAHEQRSLSLINDSLATNIDKVSNTNKLLRFLEHGTLWDCKSCIFVERQVWILSCQY